MLRENHGVRSPPRVVYENRLREEKMATRFTKLRDTLRFGVTRFLFSRTPIFSRIPGCEMDPRKPILFWHTRAIAEENRFGLQKK